MTREEAIEALTHCVDWAEHCDDTYADCVPVEALRIAGDALKQIRAIEGIISISNTTIQEDVIKYKMIVGVVEGEWLFK